MSLESIREFMGQVVAERKEEHSRAGTLDTLATLVCPKCKASRLAPVFPMDPPGTDRVEMLCPECNPSGFEEIHYYDVNGKELEP